MGEGWLVVKIGREGKVEREGKWGKTGNGRVTGKDLEREGK